MKYIIPIIIMLLLSTVISAYENVMYWGSYSKDLYNYKINPSVETRTLLIKSIKNVINTSIMYEKKVPPGMYLELALLTKQMKPKKDVQPFLDKELEIYPESAKLVKFVKLDMLGMKSQSSVKLSPDAKQQGVIMALYPINESFYTEIDDPFWCTMAEVVNSRGYYIIPGLISDKIMKNESMRDLTQVDSTEYSILKSKYNIDTIVYTHIWEWFHKKGYFAGKLSADVEYGMISTSTADTIWSFRGSTDPEPSVTKKIWSLIYCVDPDVVNMVANSLFLLNSNGASKDDDDIASELGKALFVTSPEGPYYPYGNKVKKKNKKE